MDGLSSSRLLPLVPRSSVRQISAQNKHSSTKSSLLTVGVESWPTLSLKPIVAEGWGHTLVVARRSVAERKIALAVPIFELFRARSRAATVVLMVGTASSLLVGRWRSVSIAETVGSCKGMGRYGESPAPNRDGHSIYHNTSRGGVQIRRGGLHLLIRPLEKNNG